MIINEARTLALKEMLPTMAEGDKVGVQYENGRVKVPEGFKRPHRLLLDGEWGCLMVESEMGGQGAPPFAACAAIEYFMGGNWALYSYTVMGGSTAGMIQRYGTQELKETFVKKFVLRRAEQFDQNAVVQVEDFVGDSRHPFQHDGNQGGIAPFAIELGEVGRRHLRTFAGDL